MPNKDPEKRKKYNRDWFRRNPVRKRIYHLRYKYGLTIDEYDKLVGQQDGRCALCGRKTGGVRLGKSLHLFVDHDHKSGRVRGLVCRTCNMVIGRADEVPDFPGRIVSYLASHSSDN